MKVLIFAPHSQLWKHAFPEALVAEALSQEQHDVVYITCGEALRDHCIPMIAAQIDHDAPESVKNALCKDCHRNASILRKEFGFRGYDLQSVLSPGDRSQIQAIVDTATPENLGDVVLDGIRVGRLALYQVLLRFKLLAVDNFSVDQWNEYLAQLKTTVTTVVAMKSILNREQPERILLYNGLYSVNAACRKLADSLGIPVYFLHAGYGLSNRLQTLLVARDHTLHFQRALLTSWIGRRNIPALPQLIEAVANNFLEILNGRSHYSYSAARDTGRTTIRDTFQIPDAPKIVVALLSSYDECIAAEVAEGYPDAPAPIFSDQIEWVARLIEFFRLHDNLFLIIRVHPREFPNRRDGRLSKHAQLLKRAFEDLPPNVVINWPTDKISLYDLVDETSLFLNTLSSAATEMTMLGLPVLTYDNKFVAEPVSTNYKGSIIHDYFAEMESLIASGWSAENIRRGFRWRAMELVLSSIDISESYRARDDIPWKADLPASVIRKLGSIVAPGLLRTRDCRNRAPTLNARSLINRLVESKAETFLDVRVPAEATAISLEAETEALRKAVRRIVTSLYGPGATAKGGTLRTRLMAFANGEEAC